MLAAPKTITPLLIAHKISLCHTAGTRSNEPSIMPMASHLWRTARSTSPCTTGGSTSASSSCRTSSAVRVGPAKTTIFISRHPR